MNNLYETQRMMRKARKAAIQRGVIAVLDVGTSKIACFVLKFADPEAKKYLPRDLTVHQPAHVPGKYPAQQKQKLQQIQHCLF